MRIAPNQLSYISIAAWRDIYGARGLAVPGSGDSPKKAAQMRKEELVFPGEDFEFFAEAGAKPMISCDARNHARHRRIVGHAFSHRALREYEPTLIRHVDLLMHRLRDCAARGELVNIVAWFNFVMFDITSSLVFGETFGCLGKGEYHPWVARVFPGMKLIAWSGVVAGIPGLATVIDWLIPKALVREANAHIQEVVDMTGKRMAAHPAQPDFMTHILSHNTHEKASGLSVEELYLDAQLLTIAGSETTATHLSGAVYYLSQHPAARMALIRELRAAFKSEDEILPDALSQLPYLNAVINETLRLYPPGAINMPRTVPRCGATIDGAFVPGGMEVGIAQFAAYRSPLYFKDPLKFVPERWMGLDDEYAGDKREVFQPFSYGPRNCVGQNLAIIELRLVLARLLWALDVSALPGQEGWPRQKTYLSWVKPPLMVGLSSPVATGLVQ